MFKSVATTVSMIAVGVLGGVVLSACDSKPIVVAVPVEPTPIIVAVPPGAPGPAGATGQTGATGAPGKPGESPTVVVLPPTPNPAPASSSASTPEVL